MAPATRFELTRTLEAVPKLLDTIEELLTERRVDGNATLNAQLVAEELFTNLVRHDRGGEDTIAVTVALRGPRLEMSMGHRGTERPHIPAPGEADVTTSLDTRTPGGLGVHFVRSIVDELAYDYRDGTLTVTAIMNLEQPDVQHRTG